MTDDVNSITADNTVMPDMTAEAAAPPDPSPSQDAPAPSRREALEKAFKAVESDEGQTDGRERNENGTFKGKAVDQPQGQQPQPVQDAPKPADQFQAPTRFSPDAKAEWEKTPLPVRAEISRAVRELETGIAEHQARWEPLKEFDALAKQHNTSIHAALANYVGLEQLLAKDPIAGLERVAQNMGFSLRDLAAQIAGAPQDQQLAARDQEIFALKQQIDRLTQTVGGVTSSMQQREQDAISAQIAEFAKEHPRLDELGTDIAFLIQSGRAKDLEDAYKLADRLNPAPALASPAAVQPALNPAPKPVQDRKGQLSVSGSPSNGSNPKKVAPAGKFADRFSQALDEVGYPT